MGKILIIKNANFSSVAVERINTEIKKIKITVIANLSDKGNVTGSGIYEEGTQITITATPTRGNRFVQWNDGNTNATRTVIVDSSNMFYTATFAELSAEYEEITSEVLAKRVLGSYVNYNGGYVQNDSKSAVCGSIHFTKNTWIKITAYTQKPICFIAKIKDNTGDLSTSTYLVLQYPKNATAAIYETEYQFTEDCDVVICYRHIAVDGSITESDFHVYTKYISE